MKTINQSSTCSLLSDTMKYSKTEKRSSQLNKYSTYCVIVFAAKNLKKSMCILLTNDLEVLLRYVHTYAFICLYASFKFWTSLNFMSIEKGCALLFNINLL